ncbi:MAG: lytic transglycosylase domain-containing protein [Candidatus Scatovivens sp.]
MKKIYKLLILIFILIILIIFILSRMKNLYKIEYTEIVEKYAKEFNVEKELIYSIIKNESNFDKEAKSSKNAIGLMQIIEETKNDMEKILEKENLDLLNEQDNIMVGTKYLSILEDKYENIELEIAAYNAGPRKRR